MTERDLDSRAVTTWIAIAFGLIFGGAVALFFG